MIFKIYEYFFGHCLVCYCSMNHISLCDNCLLNLKPYDFCFHDYLCMCGKDVVAFKYERFTKKILIKAKYQDDYYSVRFIANQISKKIKKKPDYLIAIPNSLRKLWKKGYNTPLEMAKIIGKNLNIPIIYPLIKSKMSYQKSKDISTRVMNSNYIKIKPNYQFPRGTFGIVDDLIASGSTINRAIDLIKPYADDIFVYTFAKT